MTTNKTLPTDVPVSEFLKTVTVKRRVEDANQLIKIYSEITQQSPVMWGPSIIGFGQRDFHYDSGRSGIMPAAGFSPRKTSLTLYVGDNFPEADSLFAQLGKFKKSVACLYINKLADIDLDVLTHIIKEDYLATQQR